jgi:hypothetical protein
MELLAARAIRLTSCLDNFFFGPPVFFVPYLVGFAEIAYHIVRTLDFPADFSDTKFFSSVGQNLPFLNVRKIRVAWHL